MNLGYCDCVSLVHIAGGYSPPLSFFLNENHQSFQQFLHSFLLPINFSIMSTTLLFVFVFVSFLALTFLCRNLVWIDGAGDVNARGSHHDC